MDDSKTSRTLPAMTRRKMLSTAATVVASTASIQAQSPNHLYADDAPLLALWREWKNIHQRRCELTVLQQNLETKLWQSTEIPMVALHIPGGAKPVLAHSPQEIKRLLPQADMVEIRNNAISELQSRQAEWDRKGWELGYNQACEEEVSADRMEWELAEALWSSSASSLLDVVAKLDCVLEMAGPDMFLQEIPVKVLRSILNELRRIVSVKQ